MAHPYNPAVRGGCRRHGIPWRRTRSLLLEKHGRQRAQPILKPSRVREMLSTHNTRLARFMAQIMGTPRIAAISGTDYADSSRVTADTSPTRAGLFLECRGGAEVSEE